MDVMHDAMRMARLSEVRSKTDVITAFTLAYTARYFSKKTVQNAPNVRRVGEEAQFLEIIKRIHMSTNLEVTIEGCHDLVPFYEKRIEERKAQKLSATGYQALLAVTQLFCETVPLHSPFQKAD